MYRGKTNIDQLSSMLELCARHCVSWSFLTSFIAWEKDLYGQSYFLTFPDQKRFATDYTIHITMIIMTSV